MVTAKARNKKPFPANVPGCGEVPKPRDAWPLAHILTRPEKYQFRDEPFSLQTVQGMLATGIDAAQFDPIPVIPGDESPFYIVAGDGHSRLEAVRRAARDDALPQEWRRGEEWWVPVRVVEEHDALLIAHEANMARTPFKPCEEARVFQARLDAGDSVEYIAKRTWTSYTHVVGRVRLLSLCREIQRAVDEPWGINVTLATVLAQRFQEAGVDHATQQQLWREVISQGEWTKRTLGMALDTLLPMMRRKHEAGMLFELGPNVGRVVRDATALTHGRRRVKAAMERLLRAQADGTLEQLPGFEPLHEVVALHGEAYLTMLEEADRRDAEVLACLRS